MKVRIPSPAMIVASLALLFALGGTAVASGLITGAQIKNNTISSLDLTNNGVKTIDVQNGTLRAADFAPGVLPKSGAVGPAGPAGAQGVAGPQGAPGLAGLEIVTADSVNNSDNVKQTDVSCPAGKQVVGGGGHVVNAAGSAALDESYPASSTKWRATAYEINATAGNWHLQAYAICATVAA